MIGYPRTPGEFEYYREFLAQRELFISPSAHVISWLTDGKPSWVLAMDSWVGQTCQLMVANAKTGQFPPRAFIKALFNYIFNTIDRRYAIAVVKSDNVRAIRLDLWLGFEETGRLPDAFKDGSDLVMFTMDRSKCRWIGHTHGQRLSTNS